MARIYIRRSSQNYDQYRIQLYNGYIDGDKEYPVTMANANRRIEYHKLFKFLCKGEGNSTQYGQSGKAKPTDADDDGKEVDRSQNFQDPKKYPCFCCERFYPKCSGIRNCSHTTEKDGSTVNSKEDMEKKFEEQKKSK